jgi:PAS domain S-box-containing protein
VFRLYAGDGSLRWLMTCAQAAREPGKPFTRLVGVNVDVTDTVQAEDELDAARVERSRQEQIMRAVMEHAPVGIAVALQGEAQLAYVSRFGTRMIQATPEQGRAWSAWRIHHPDSRAPAKTEDLPLFRACQGAVVRNEEWLLQALDGTLVPISCNAGPIHDAEGQVIGGTVAWDDVTPFKEAQRQRDLFLAAVSHELRTPLSAIHGWAEALRRNRDASLLDRALDSIRRNVETQARLVDDLLDAARIAAGKLSLALAPDDLAQIVRAAVDTATPIAAAAQVVLDLTPIDEALPVMADGLRMRQVVCNLLTNAVKFSRPGGRVQVTARRRDGFGDIEVTDDGAGIDAAELGRVFDQFWQSGAGAGRKEGLGLGLSIARYIVQGHGGRVSAHSDGIGRGSTFLVRLPLRT